MIYVTIKKSKTGFRLQLKNKNGNIFNHSYNHKHDAKKAFLALVKQLKEGKFEIVEEKKSK